MLRVLAPLCACFRHHWFSIYILCCVYWTFMWTVVCVHEYSQHMFRGCVNSYSSVFIWERTEWMLDQVDGSVATGGFWLILKRLNLGVMIHSVINIMCLSEWKRYTRSMAWWIDDWAENVQFDTSHNMLSSTLHLVHWTFFYASPALGLDVDMQLV